MRTDRIVTYARVSTAEQVSTGTSLEDQRTRLSAAVQARGGEHVGHFVDAGVSGSLTSRPGLDALRQEVSRGGVDLVIATKIDRVSRSALGLLNLVEELRGHGCHLVLIDEGLDTSTPAGDLTSGVLGVIGGWERRRIAERTKQGRLNAAVEGRFVASTPPFGYRVVPAPDGRGKRLAVHDEDARTIRAMYEQLVVLGRDQQDVADYLNEANHRPPVRSHWTAESVGRWARRRQPLSTASGVWHFSGTAVAVPALLTPEQTANWARWQAGGRRTQQSRGPYLLSGFLQMPCGDAAMGRTAGSRRPTYSCRKHYLPRHDPERHDLCHNISRDVTDHAVREEITRLIAQPVVLGTLADRRLGRHSEASRTVASLMQGVADVEGAISRDASALRGQGFSGSALASALSPLRDEHARLTAELTTMQRQITRRAVGTDPMMRKHLIDALTTNLTAADDTTMRNLLGTLDARIHVIGYQPCSTCTGTGYLAFAPGSTRHPPQTCRHCLKGRNPDLRIELDDIAALALTMQLSGKDALNAG
ncbi:recombinase family protein [Knoellia sp. S7-12]|uniref:recombinase family protein n=1 Tax=Knoellia sp. S7-12 TaxID=3126698 RepID=UPI00336907D8